MKCKMTKFPYYLFVLFILLVPVADADVFITSPGAGDRLPDLNTSLVVNASEIMTSCQYTLNEFVPEHCTFNSTTNITGFFGWNRLEVCGVNASGGSECDSLNFWCDKRDKDVSDYFTLILLLGLGLLFGLGGYAVMGLLGIIGGILVFIAGLEAIALGINSFAYMLFLLSIMCFVGSVVRR